MNNYDINTPQEIIVNEIHRLQAELDAKIEDLRKWNEEKRKEREKNV